MGSQFSEYITSKKPLYGWLNSLVEGEDGQRFARLQSDLLTKFASVSSDAKLKAILGERYTVMQIKEKMRAAKARPKKEVAIKALTTPTPPDDLREEREQ